MLHFEFIFGVENSSRSKYVTRVLSLAARACNFRFEAVSGLEQPLLNVFQQQHFLVLAG